MDKNNLETVKSNNGVKHSSIWASALVVTSCFWFYTVQVTTHDTNQIQIKEIESRNTK